MIANALLTTILTLCEKLLTQAFLGRLIIGLLSSWAEKTNNENFEAMVQAVADAWGVDATALKDHIAAQRAAKAEQLKLVAK